MRSCDLGLMNEGLLAVRVPALKMRAMRFVLVSSAAYTTVKQKPAPNLRPGYGNAAMPRVRVPHPSSEVQATPRHVPRELRGLERGSDLVLRGGIHPPLHAADHVGGPQDEGEGDTVAEHDAREQHVGELAARGAHHRRLVVAHEDTADEEREQDAARREGHGADGPAAVGAQEHLGDFLAPRLVGGGQRARGARLA